MKRSMLFTAAIAVLMLAGCSHDNGPTGRSAIDEANASEAKTPDVNADTYFAAGQLAESQNAFDLAIKNYDKALKLDPKHRLTLYRLGFLLARLNRFPEAIQTWRTYVSATDESPDAYADLGFCLELSGQPEQAAEQYKKGIAKDTQNLACRTNYGLMEARHNRISEAIRIWQPVLTEAEIHYNLAGVYELDGRKLQAKTEYEKALELAPDFSDAKNRLASLSMD